MPKPRFGPQTAETEPAKPNVAESLVCGGFGSHHPGGFNTSFADGSTRFVTENVDLAIWRLVGNRSDGEIVKPF